MAGALNAVGDGMRVTIVGGGIMGLSAAWAAARDGHRVTVIERGPTPNPVGSSVDSHRLIRYPYGALDGYTRLVADAYRAWERLWGDLGVRHYVATGTLVVATGDARWPEESAAAMAAAGLELERIDTGRLERLCPGLETDGVTGAWYAATGGVLLADRIVASLARALAAAGVVLRTNADVRAVDPDACGVVLEGGERVAADRLVIAAGPWLPRLLPGWAGRVTPSRQVVVYLDGGADLLRRWERVPMVMDIGDGRGFYLVPPVAGTGFKVGDHVFSMQGDPDAPRDPTAADVAAVLDQCRGRLRDFDRYRVSEARVCFYTVADGERFVIEPLAERAWVMTGFSGHGFKFGPLMGELVADALCGRRAPGTVTAIAAGREPADA